MISAVTKNNLNFQESICLNIKNTYYNKKKKNIT